MERKIVAYEIAESSRDTLLEDAVKTKMIKGFEPVGPHSCYEGFYQQTMVKYEDVVDIELVGDANYLSKNDLKRLLGIMQRLFDSSYLNLSADSTEFIERCKGMSEKMK